MPAPIPPGWARRSVQLALLSTAAPRLACSGAAGSSPAQAGPLAERRSRFPARRSRTGHTGRSSCSARPTRSRGFSAEDEALLARQQRWRPRATCEHRREDLVSFDPDLHALLPNVAQLPQHPNAIEHRFDSVPDGITNISQPRSPSKLLQPSLSYRLDIDQNLTDGAVPRSGAAANARLRAAAARVQVRQQSPEKTRMPAITVPSPRRGVPGRSAGRASRGVRIGDRRRLSPMRPRCVPRTCRNVLAVGEHGQCRQRHRGPQDHERLIHRYQADHAGGLVGPTSSPWSRPQQSEPARR
ncbi:hypothetical protein SAMN05660733_02855 [Lentzea albidocapillata]|uniref:Uncharacterized protein n=1 Tax=Lentzea albidocapillata TaxID=40571 RepID=A0A1W2DBV0_9PSEU|nr:hypothetical protein SAMN05660733_02855 [Lentzea albidocapillata]